MEIKEYYVIKPVEGMFFETNTFYFRNIIDPALNFRSFSLGMERSRSDTYAGGTCSKRRYTKRNFSK